MFIKVKLSSNLMKIAVLFSGGKDSSFAFYKARRFHDVVCLVSLISKNQESYMFHVPNVELTKIQAEAAGLPLIQKRTKGEKEKELEDLRKALIEAKERFGIKGVVTGAIKSTYQASRVQKICNQLDLWCFNPLWLKDSEQLMEELISSGFKVKITAVACEGLGKDWLGKTIDKENIKNLKALSRKFGFNLGFEGGEAETFVVDAPVFEKRIEIVKARKDWQGNSGVYRIEKVRLIEACVRF